MDSNEMLNNNQQFVAPQTQFETPMDSLKNNKLKLCLLLGGAFVLIMIIIVGLVVTLNNSGGSVDGELDYYYAEMDLFDANDVGFLGTDVKHPTRYEIFDEYEQYEDCYSSIDDWVKDLIKKRATKLDTGTSDELILDDEDDEDDWDDEDDEDDWDDEDDEDDWGDEDDEDDLDDGLGDDTKEDSSVSEQQKKTMLAEYRKSIELRAEKIKKGFDEESFDKDFFDNHYLALVEHTEFGGIIDSWDEEEMKQDGDVLNVDFKIETRGTLPTGVSRIYFIIVPKTSNRELTSVDVSVNETSVSEPWVAYKPIIYIYPVEETNVFVELKNADLITTSYPKYINGWNVLARPNGDLIDNKTGRSLYSLYYESENTVDFKIENDGFVVKGEDVAEFLEEKLSILGLNEREAEEFIVYWLPKLEANEYNYIRFATTSEINKNIPLEITPQPDTVIRILMTYRGLDKPISVTPQILAMPERAGFTVVEWGGTEIR